MARIAARAERASAELAQQRGTFPNFARSRLAEQGRRLRNATVTSIAPTGTLSMLADCSGGIEPFFALAFVRHVLDGARLPETNDRFEAALRARRRRQRGAARARARATAARAASRACRPRSSASSRSPSDIAPEAHLDVQEAFQRHVDNAVSKTINLPASATPEDVRAIYTSAWRRGLKGVTVFREGCKSAAVLVRGEGGARRARRRRPSATAPRSAAGRTRGSLRVSRQARSERRAIRSERAASRGVAQAGGAAEARERGFDVGELRDAAARARARRAARRARPLRLRPVAQQPHVHGCGSRGGRERDLARRAEAIAQRAQDLGGGGGAEAGGERDERGAGFVEAVGGGEEPGGEPAWASRRVRARAHQPRGRDLGLRKARRPEGVARRARGRCARGRPARRGRAPRARASAAPAAASSPRGASRQAATSQRARPASVPRSSPQRAPGADPGAPPARPPRAPPPSCFSRGRGGPERLRAARAAW